MASADISRDLEPQRGYLLRVARLQLRDEAFAGQVLETLREAALTPDRLQIEIAESVLIEHSDAAKAALTTLRKAGVRVALDDFGTGYSSINYLRRFAVDKLKIDRSFAWQLDTDDEVRAIIEAMVGLARALKMQVAVDGIETAAQRDVTLAIGCNELQGALLAPPMTEVEMRQIMSTMARTPPHRTLSAG